jgi:hypothetical protein
VVQLCEIPVVNQIEVEQRKSKQELVEIVDKSVGTKSKAVGIAALHLLRGDDLEGAESGHLGGPDTYIFKRKI